MRVRLFALLMLGAVMALVAGGATFSYTRSMEAELSAAKAAVRAFGETQSVPVPLRDIPRGSVVTEADFTTIRLLQEHMPANLLKALPEGGSHPHLVALADLDAGQILPDTSIGRGDADLIAVGGAGRSLAVRAANFADHAEDLKVGDWADLFWTRDIGGGTSETRLIGNALRIMALPQQVQLASEGSVSIPRAAGLLFLEVGPRDAARILEASQGGSFNILPTRERLSSGADLVEVGPLELQSLPLAVRAGGSGAAPVAALQGQRCTAMVVRAGQRASVEVPC